MPLARDISRGGISAGSAQAINGQGNAAVSTAGSTITDATDLNASWNVITTATAGQGVQLPSMLVGDTVEVYNGSGVASGAAFYVYPDQSTVAINQLSVGSPVLLAINTGCTFRKVSSTQIWANLSA